MKLANVAKRFDTTVVADAYNPGTTFLCQVEPLNMARILGPTIGLRKMSCAPSVTVPARGVIRLEGKNYLAGDGSPDHWKGEPIRINFVIQDVTGLATLNSVSGALAGTTPVSAYTALIFARDLPGTPENSQYVPQFQALFAGTETLPEGTVIQLGAQWFLVNDSYTLLSGLRVALVDELKGSVFETATANSEVFNPITEASTPTPVTVKVMRVRWRESFTYLSRAQIEYARGDEQVFILKSAMTPKPADTLVLSDGTWRVLDVQDDGTVWSCHVRR